MRGLFQLFWGRGGDPGVGLLPTFWSFDGTLELSQDL